MNNVQQIISGIPPFVYGVSGLCVAVLLILFIKKIEYNLAHQQLGFGFLAHWIPHNADEKDGLGNVKIVARLIDSPAGRAGMPNGCWLLSENGIPLQNISLQQYLEHFKGRIPVIGQEYLFEILVGDDVFDIAMSPELIQGLIPFRVASNGPMPNMHGNESDFEMGMTAHFEPRTGLTTLCPCYRLSGNAVSRFTD